jgi:hypothetical protein
MTARHLIWYNEYTQEKAERFDVNCRTDDGTQIDLEMQASRIQEDTDGEHKNLKGKSVYYLCDLHKSQRSKGEMRYDRLAMTYQVTFCSYTVFADCEEYVNAYSLRHDKSGKLLSDAIHVVYVELSKLERIEKKAVEEMTELEKWAVFRSRRMYQTDLASDMATVKDRGIAKGMEKGIEKVIRNALMNGFSTDQIHVITGLDIDAIKKLGASEQVTGTQVNKRHPCRGSERCF